MAKKREVTVNVYRMAGEGRKKVTVYLKSGASFEFTAVAVTIRWRDPDKTVVDMRWEDAKPEPITIYPVDVAAVLVDDE